MFLFYWLKLLKNNFLFLILFVAAFMIHGFLVSSIFKLFDIHLPNVLEDESILFKIFLAIIFAPLLETLLFQFLVYKGLERICRDGFRSYIFLISSAVIFAAQHFYSVWYIVGTIIPGILLAHCLLHFTNQYSSTKYGFWFTALSHGLCNSVVLFSEFI